ncbi:thioredoxin, mitochondrial isoform X1 [Apteryx mantelli]|uniref:Thioredoxin, mitochondrial n=3 Tax=Apteryx TaxID=8821 RepID=A0A8B9Q721_APTOW
MLGRAWVTSGPGKMAQKLVLRRLLSLAPRTLSPPGPWAGLPPRVPHGPLVPPGPPAPGRALATLAGCGSTFNVQDGSDFQDRVVNNPKPVVVDFHAQWCGPCKILGPRLEKMVAKQEGKVLMAKVDIDDHTDLAIEYEVSAVPTVLAMKNGDVVDKFVGIKDEDQLEAFLKKLIGA